MEQNGSDVILLVFQQPYNACTATKWNLGVPELFLMAFCKECTHGCAKALHIFKDHGRDECRHIWGVPHTCAKLRKHNFTF